MAENAGRVPPTVPGTGAASDDGKKRRNFLNKNASRLRSRLSKSPKGRAATPEPEDRAYTDDSEKDASDGDNLGKSSESVTGGVTRDGDGKGNAGIRRFISRRNKVNAVRSRSLDRNLTREPESEDDFETIRRMHKSKELEEEKKEAEKLVEDSKPRVREELREFVPKDMPPLIVAPKDVKKRKRHKSLPLQDFTGSEDDQPKTPILKPKPMTRRKPLASEEDDGDGNRRPNDDVEFDTTDTGVRQRHAGSRKSSECVADDANEVDEKKCEEAVNAAGRQWFFKRWFSRSKTAEKKDKPEEKVVKPVPIKVGPEEPKMPRRWMVSEVYHEWRAHVRENEAYYRRCQKLRNRCLADLILLLFICGCGGFIFRFTEGAFESFYKCGVKRVKRDFIDTLWKYSQYMLEEDWKSQARRRLMEFENQLHSAHEAGMTTYSGQKSWSFLNAVVYCLTVVTTIGYGHISPSTTTGRAITIIYAIFGIPMFLILLADFGKLFTRGIKFLWAFVRRLYYTGSCRRVRKTAPVQEVMKGAQILYDFAKTRKFSTAPGMEREPQHHLKPPEPAMQGVPETPGTPNWSNFEIDDEFNLPISVAISILLIYIFLGAFLYWMWEDWSFFESFYFVFISMSTIGFGDFVPQHPIYMMLSIVYLIFGLALTSMCINVVQEKLSDTFRQASVKLGTTIGLSVEEPLDVSQNPNLNPNQIHTEQNR